MTTLRLGDQDIIVHHLALVRGLPVRRTWRERLWSWPWRPWVATTRPMVPGFYILSPGIGHERTRWYCHPALLDQLRDVLNKAELGLARWRAPVMCEGNEAMVCVPGGSAGPTIDSWTNSQTEGDPCQS